MNKVILTGRLARDPELRYIPDGSAVCEFCIAVNGFKKDDVDFINCVAWKKQAELVSKSLSKGSKCLVEGRLNIQKYTKKDGSNGYKTQVILNHVEFLDSKPKSNDMYQSNENEVPF